MLSCPDSAAFDIPDDITIDWFGSVDNPFDIDQSLFGQWNTVGNMRSWVLRLNFNVGPVTHPHAAFWWSNTGSGSGATSVLPPLPIRPGVSFGLRATRRRSDALVKVYFSATDSPNWELILTSSLGTAGQTLFNATQPLMIGGTGSSAGSASMHTGHFRRAELRNGFDGAGTVIASPNATLQTPGATSFVDAQGNTWTLGPGTSLAARQLPSAEYQALWVGDKRVWPISNGHSYHGVAAGGNYSVVATPAIAAYNVADLDARWFGAINWTTSGAMFNQWDVNGGQRAWLMEMGGGQCRLSFSTTGANQFMTPLVNFPFGVGANGGVRFTRVQSTGAVKLYFSTDGINWVEQAGGAATVAAGTAMFNSTAQLMFGGYNTNGVSGQIIGVTHYAELRNGINGSVVFRHGSESLRGLTRKQASWTCETGQVVTRAGGPNPAPWVYPTVRPDDLVDIYEGDQRTWPGGDGHVTLNGTNGTDLVAHEEIFLTPRIGVVTTPDPGPLPTNCVFIMKLRGPNTGATTQIVVDQGFIGALGNDISWFLRRYVGASAFNGDMQFSIYTDGTTTNFTTGILDASPVTNADEWLACAVVHGAGGGVTFTGTVYRSTNNGSTWTQLSTGGTSTNVVAWDSARPVTIGGSSSTVDSRLNGRIYSVELRTGLNPAAGTTIWKFDAKDYRQASTRTAGVFLCGGTGAVGGVVSTTGYDITTDVVITARCTMQVGNNAQYLVDCWGSGATTQGWWLGLSSAEAFQFGIQDSGNVIQTFDLLSTAELAAQGILGNSVVADIGVRFQLNSAGTCRAVAIHSTDGGAVWNEIGTAKTGTVVAASRVVGVPVAIGTRSDRASALDWSYASSGGRIYKAEMRTGTDPNGGTVAWRFDPVDYPVSDTTKAWTDPRGRAWGIIDPELMGDVSYTDPRSRVWTVERNGAIEGASFNTGNVGSAEVVVKPRSGWPGATVQTLIAKWGDAPNNAWAFVLGPSGYLQFYWTTDGTFSTVNAVQASAALTFPTDRWMRLGVSWDTQYNGGTQFRLIFSGALDGQPMQVLQTITFAPGTNFNMVQGTAPITVGSIYVDWWANVDCKYATVNDGAGNAVWTMDRSSFKVGRRATSLASRPQEGAYFDPYNTGVLSMPDPGQLGDEFTFVYKKRGPITGTSGVRFIISQGASTAADRSFKFGHGISGNNLLSTSLSLTVYPLGTSTGAIPYSPNFSPYPNTYKPQVHAFSINAGNSFWQPWVYENGVWIPTTSGSGTAYVPFDSSSPIVIGDDGSNSSTSWWDSPLHWVEMRTGMRPDRGKVLWRFDANDYPGGGVTTWTDPRGHVWSVVGTYASRAIVPLSGDIAVRGAAKVYPTVSEMKARWGEFQWNDGSKWSA